MVHDRDTVRPQYFNTTTTNSTNMPYTYTDWPLLGAISENTVDPFILEGLPREEDNYLQQISKLFDFLTKPSD